jgi:hypothetical protein
MPNVVCFKSREKHSKAKTKEAAEVKVNEVKGG